MLQTSKTALQKAQQKYTEAKRNYYAHKDVYEDHYLCDKQVSSQEIQKTEFKMNQEYDLMQTLVYIFGNEVR